VTQREVTHWGQAVTVGLEQPTIDFIFHDREPPNLGEHNNVMSPIFLKTLFFFLREF